MAQERCALLYITESACDSSGAGRWGQACLCSMVEPAGAIIAKDVLEQLSEALIEEATVVVPAKARGAHERVQGIYLSSGFSMA